MNIDIIFRIAAVGLLVSILNLILEKSGRNEHALMVTIAGLIVVLLLVITEIDNLFSTIRTVFRL